MSARPLRRSIHKPQKHYARLVKLRERLDVLRLEVGKLRTALQLSTERAANDHERLWCLRTGDRLDATRASLDDAIRLTSTSIDEGHLVLPADRDPRGRLKARKRQPVQRELLT